MRSIDSKIVTLKWMMRERASLRKSGMKLVFTNGCFDLLHVGHVDYLAFARSLGDALLVAVNADASVRRNKGPSRPLVPELERARMLAALESVDYVMIFRETTPCRLLRALRPDILVKGADWSHQVVGREIVESYGGAVTVAPVTRGKSTTALIEKILANAAANPAGKRSESDKISHEAKH